jgi:hypothetical protein
MSGDKVFPRQEWSMYIDVPKTEYVPCFCYELTRAWIVDRRKSPKWDYQAEEWAKNFAKPYLLLSAKERKIVSQNFPSYYGKKLQDFAKPNRTAAQIGRDVEIWQSLHANYGSGRASPLARIGLALKYLGSYRILQRYRWNQLPLEPDITFFSNQREWIAAKREAKRLINSWWALLLYLRRHTAETRKSE